MSHNEYRKSKISLILILSLFLLAGSCDHTRLTGEIMTNKKSIKLGEEVSLELKLPADLDEIYGIYWEVEPKEFGELKYINRGVGALQNINGEYKVVYKDDMKATFKPQKSGDCIINVFGYYKQTNPQHITSISLTIIK